MSKSFGELVREIRKEQGENLEQMGSRIGFHSGMVSKIETGERPGSKKFVESLFQKYQLSDEMKMELLKANGMLDIEIVKVIQSNSLSTGFNCSALQTLPKNVTKVGVFGSVVKDIRKKVNENLSTMAKNLGISQSSLASIESGSRKATKELIEKISTIYNLDNDVKRELERTANIIELTVSIDTSNFSEDDREIVLSFGKKFLNISEKDRNTIYEILSKYQYSTGKQALKTMDKFEEKQVVRNIPLQDVTKALESALCNAIAPMQQQIETLMAKNKALMDELKANK